MTRADAWKQRPVVLFYHVFRDQLVFLMKKDGVVPEDFCKLDVCFYLPMPKSWSEKKKLKILGSPHQQKPDIDNLQKALLDSIFRDGDDSMVYDIHATKRWSENIGRIEIEIWPTK